MENVEVRPNDLAYMRKQLRLHNHWLTQMDDQESLKLDLEENNLDRPNLGVIQDVLHYYLYCTDLSKEELVAHVIGFIQDMKNGGNYDRNDVEIFGDLADTIAPGHWLDPRDFRTKKEPSVKSNDRYGIYPVCNHVAEELEALAKIAKNNRHPELKGLASKLLDNVISNPFISYPAQNGHGGYLAFNKSALKDSVGLLEALPKYRLLTAEQLRENRTALSYLKKIKKNTLTEA